MKCSAQRNHIRPWEFHQGKSIRDVLTTMIRALVVALVVVVGASIATAAPDAKPNIAVIGAQVRDDATNFLSTDQPVLDAIATPANADMLATCASGVTFDIDHPSQNILIDIIISVNDKLHASADLKHDPNFGNAIAKPAVGATCVAPIVTRWKFPKAGRFVVRIGIVPPMSVTPGDLPKGYVESLQAVCAAPSAKERDPAKQARRIKDALAAHPSPQVENLLRSIGGQWPSARPTIIRAAIANAGLESCRLIDLN